MITKTFSHDTLLYTATKFTTLNLLLLGDFGSVVIY